MSARLKVFLALLLFSLTPLVISSYLIYHQAANFLLKHTFHEHELVIQQEANLLAQRLEVYHKALDVITQLPDPNDQEQMLAQIVAYEPSFIDYRFQSQFQSPQLTTVSNHDMPLYEITAPRPSSSSGYLTLQVSFNELTRQIGHKKSRYQLLLIDDTGTVLLHPHNADSLETNNYFEEQPELQANLQTRDQFLYHDQAEDELRTWHKIFFDPQNSERYWVLLSIQPEPSVLANNHRLQAFILMLISSLLLISAVFSLWLTQRFADPLMRLQEQVQKMSRGNLTQPITTTAPNPEVRELSKNIEQLRRQLLYQDQETQAQVETQTKEIANQKKALLNVLEDIETEKSTIEQQAQDLKKFEMAVQRATDLIVITDPEGTVVYANPATQRITGYSLKEAVGSKAGVLWGRQMPQEFYQKMWHRIKDEKKSFRGQMTNKRKDGRLFITDLTITPLLDARGEVLFFVSIQRDITKEHEINKMKTEFISLASHQLRTPLTSIKWNLELLRDEGQLPESLKQLIGDIHRSNERMIALVNSLLNISRIESGRIIIDPEPTDIKDLLEDIIMEFKPQLHEKNLDLQNQIPADLPHINIDPKLVGEAFKNILSNAIKYTPAEGQITVKSFIKQDSLVTEISDTGLGIPEPDQRRIYEKFHRGSNVIQSETEGTGLGLYLTKAIIDSSGGRIHFDSAVGQGTTFWIELPLDGSPDQEGEVELTGENFNRETAPHPGT